MNLHNKVSGGEKTVLGQFGFTEFTAPTFSHGQAEELACRGYLVRGEKVERPLLRSLPDDAPVTDMGVLNRGILETRARTHTYRLSRRGMKVLGRAIPKPEKQAPVSESAGDSLHLQTEWLSLTPEQRKEVLSSV